MPNHVNQDRLGPAWTLGAMSAIASYVILSWIDSPWEEVIPAFLIGGCCGLIEGRYRHMVQAAIWCVSGWLLGAILFGYFIHLGIGAWIPASIFVLLAATKRKTVLRITYLAAVGFIVGIIIEGSRYITLVSPSLRNLDMQLVLILSAGAILPPICWISSKQRRGKLYEISQQPVRAA